MKYQQIIFERSFQLKKVFFAMKLPSLMMERLDAYTWFLNAQFANVGVVQCQWSSVVTAENPMAHNYLDGLRNAFMPLLVFLNLTVPTRLPEEKYFAPKSCVKATKMASKSC